MLYRIIKSPEDHHTLHHDLNNIIEMGKHLVDEDRYVSVVGHRLPFLQPIIFKQCSGGTYLLGYQTTQFNVMEASHSNKATILPSVYCINITVMLRKQHITSYLTGICLPLHGIPTNNTYLTKSIERTQHRADQNDERCS